MFKNFSWAHGVIIALALFISFILFMIFVFSHGQQTSELVSNDYYGDELVYQEVIDAKNNAGKLSEIPKYQEVASGIKITFPSAIVPEDKKVKLELFRTDDANLDVKKEELLDANYEILIPKQILSKGPYTLKLKWSNAKIPYQVDYDVLWK
jgi:hypothetical protein